MNRPIFKEIAPFGNAQVPDSFNNNKSTTFVNVDEFIDENGMLVLYLYEHSDDKRSPESPRFEFTEK